MSCQPTLFEAGAWAKNISGTNMNGMEVKGEKADSVPSTDIPGDNSPRSPAAIPISDSSSLSVQAPSSPSLSVKLPEPAASFGRKWAQSQATVIDRSPLRVLRGTGFTSDVHKEVTPGKMRRSL